VAAPDKKTRYIFRLVEETATHLDTGLLDKYMDMQLCYCYDAAVRRKTPPRARLERRVTMVTACLKY
jgi:hypothetical protein